MEEPNMLTVLVAILLIVLIAPWIVMLVAGALIGLASWVDSPKVK